MCESILYSRCKKSSKSQCFYHRISIEWTSLCKETYAQYIAPEKNFHTTCWHDDLFTVFRGVCICFRIWKSKLVHSFLILLVYSTMMIFMSRDPPPPPLHSWILMPNPWHHNPLSNPCGGWTPQPNILTPAGGNLT